MALKPMKIDKVEAEVVDPIKESLKEAERIYGLSFLKGLSFGFNLDSRGMVTTIDMDIPEAPEISNKLDASVRRWPPEKIREIYLPVFISILR